MERLNSGRCTAKQALSNELVEKVVAALFLTGLEKNPELRQQVRLLRGGGSRRVLTIGVDSWCSSPANE